RSFRVDKRKRAKARDYKLEIMCRQASRALARVRLILDKYESTSAKRSNMLSRIPNERAERSVHEHLSVQHSRDTCFSALRTFCVSPNRWDWGIDRNGYR